MLTSRFGLQHLRRWSSSSWTWVVEAARPCSVAGQNWGFLAKQSRMLSSGNVAEFVVGNTYNRLSNEEANFDRTNTRKKIHDWSLYVDVINGDPDLIKNVEFNLGPTFKPETFVCSSPVPVTRSDKSKAWRFATRQQSYGSLKKRNAKIRICGSSGTIQELPAQVILDNSKKSQNRKVHTFEEHEGKKSLQMLELPFDQDFGIELELLCSGENISAESVARTLETQSTGSIQAHSYGEGRAAQAYWKVVPDSSIRCSPENNSCTPLELVSPVLRGGDGLSEIHSILQKLQSSRSSFEVNRSMGFHLHLDVSNLSHLQLVKLCQNFVKYEDILDRLQPVSRRSGNANSNQYCLSNKATVNAIAGVNTNKGRHNAIYRAQDIHSLATVMTNGNRHHKLNLQNLVTGRQSTIEFRQHSATLNYKKIAAWVRFCTAFVRNSARLRDPTPFKEGRSLEFQFDALFRYVIKDRALREFYRGRLEELNDDIGCGCDESDCDGC